MEIKVDNDSANLSTTASHGTLSMYVRQAVNDYFAQLNGHPAANLYAMVINEVEKPLLETALQHSGQNQTKAAKALGLSRSTLRKKLEQHGIS